MAPYVLNGRLPEGDYWLETALNFFRRYFSVINPEIAIKFVYEGLLRKDVKIKKICLKLFEDLNLLDYKYVIDIIDSGNFEDGKRAILTLKFHKNFYKYEDIQFLEVLKEKLTQTFPVKSKVVENNGGLLSKNKEKWECECGKLNDMNTEYCFKCGHDKYGFTGKEMNPEQAINLIDNNLEVLKGYFKI